MYRYYLDDPVNLIDPLGLRGKSDESVGDIFDRISDTPAGRIVFKSLASAGTGAIMGSTGAPAGMIIGAGSGFARGTMISAAREIPQVRNFENKLKDQGLALWESIMADEESD